MQQFTFLTSWFNGVTYSYGHLWKIDNTETGNQLIQTYLILINSYLVGASNILTLLKLVK